MRKLPRETRAFILSALTDGAGVNATARIRGVSKLNVLPLLCDAGTLAAGYHDLMVRRLKTTRVEVDEPWSFVGCKERSKALGAQGFGDAWVWVGLDSNTKLCIGYHVGDRNEKNATTFLQDVASRLTGRVQLTSDGHRAYLPAGEEVFGGAVDHGVLVEEFEVERANEIRYSQPKCVAVPRTPMQGNPSYSLISTSYVERQNLTFRMSSRRFTRLTTGYSRRIENHLHAISLHFLAYNFIKKHSTLKTTPAVAAGIAAKPMTMLDFVDLLEREERLCGGRLSDYQPAKKHAS